MKVTLPMKTKNTSNEREHWAAKHKRTAPQRRAARLAVKAKVNLGELGPTHLVVLLTRIAPSDGVDDDGLRSALKEVRDGVASALWVDDRTPLVRWDYAQRRGDDYAVEILISWETVSDFDHAFPPSSTEPTDGGAVPRGTARAPKTSDALAAGAPPSPAGRRAVVHGETLQQRLNRLARPATYRSE